MSTAPVMAYEEFLASKRVVATPVGFGIDRDDLHESLFDFQKDIVLWAVQRGRAAIFSECGCVAGETIIQSPDGDTRIDVLAQRGDPVRVWSLDMHGRRVIAHATTPFRKGKAALYEFRLASGRRITVMDRHRFLTPDGWTFASQMHVGAQLAVSSLVFPQNGGRVHDSVAMRASSHESLPTPESDTSGHFPAWPRILPASSSVVSPSVFRQDDPDCVQRPEGFQDRYVACSHPDDEPLLPESDTVQGRAPSPIGVRERTRGSWPVDGQADESAHIHLYQSDDLPSMRDYAHPGVSEDHGEEYCGVSSLPTRPISIRRDDRQCDPFAIPVQSDGEWHQYPRESGGVQFEPYETSFDTVVAIKYIRTDDYYDMHVPGHENYLANGVWNHNTGKTRMQLEWARHVQQQTGGDVLILAPLAVAAQTVREARDIGIEITHCRTGEDIRPGISITNYERLHYMAGHAFAAIVLDESGILKGYDSATRKAIQAFVDTVHYRLACTATPAPNDLIELANHAEFLGVMGGKEIIALFFTQDGNTTHKWRLKGHARQDFWRWMASWSMAVRYPSDLGYPDGDFILPELRMHQHTVDAKITTGTLFAMEAQTLQERQQARRDSIGERVAMTAGLVNSSDDQWLIWCDLNAESEALRKAIPGAVEVRGSDSVEHKEQAILDFVDGSIRVLVSKPSITGFGVNLQNCHKMAFVGLSDSFERQYQAIRRCWRFGQTCPVDVHVITAETEGAVVANIERKEKQAAMMMGEIVKHMQQDHDVIGQIRDEAAYQEDVVSGKNWTLYLGDSVETIKQVTTDSVGLSVYSPPFPGMYAYTNSAHDMGNVASIEELMNQYRYLIPELLRITMPGRSTCVHLTQAVAFKGSDGYIGIKDFRGKVIEAYEAAGWIYYGEVTIDKNPQLKAQRTKDRGLMFKTLATDSAHMHMALADYLMQFRKPGDNPEPIRAGISTKYDNPHGWISDEQWIEWAAPVWYGAYKGLPGGIRETDVLNVRQARETDDERHLAPLQLGVIERAVKLWSNPGDIVYDPFTGIGSTAYVALGLNRKFVGGELKESYFRTAITNANRAITQRSQNMLFDLSEVS